MVDKLFWETLLLLEIMYLSGKRIPASADHESKARESEIWEHDINVSFQESKPYRNMTSL